MATSTKRLSSEQTLTLWKQYQRSSDPALRDRLVLTFAPLVKYIVYKKVREMPARCEVEDFISCGLEALIRSIDRYDPSKGATLEQYAWTRIHGAVLDELRRQDWAPRSVRRWERDIEKASVEFTALHGRHPSSEELAESIGCSVRSCASAVEEISRSDLTSLNTARPLRRRDDDRADGHARLPRTSASTPSTPPRPRTRRTASARRSASCRAVSARSPCCST